MIVGDMSLPLQKGMHTSKCSCRIHSFRFLNTTAAHVDNDVDDFWVDGRIEVQDRWYRPVAPLAPPDDTIQTKTGAADFQMVRVTMVDFSVRRHDARVFEHDGNRSWLPRGVGRAERSPALASVGTLQLQGFREAVWGLPVVLVVCH